VLVRTKQKIFLLRDVFSSFTAAKLIADEKSTTLRDVIMETTADLKSPHGAVIRVDGAPAFISLANDPFLRQNGITLEIGRLKNINKNPIGEKAIQELEMELRKQHPSGSPLTPASLAIAVSTLNTNFTNDVVRILTVVFTSMLPFVVISGIYGMNLPLPVWHGPGGSSMDYIYILLASAAISAILILYFRLRSWI